MAGVNVNNPFQLDDPNAILASQNAGITANLAGQGRGTPLSQYGAGLGALFSRFVFGDPAVQKAQAEQSAGRAAVTPQNDGESDIDYALRTAHGMYNAIAPLDPNKANAMMEHIVTLQQAKQQQSLLATQEQGAEQSNLIKGTTAGQFEVISPDGLHSYGALNRLTSDGKANPDWDTQLAAIKQDHPDGVVVPAEFAIGNRAQVATMRAQGQYQAALLRSQLAGQGGFQTDQDAKEALGALMSGSSSMSRLTGPQRADVMHMASQSGINMMMDPARAQAEIAGVRSALVQAGSRTGRIAVLENSLYSNDPNRPGMGNLVETALQGVDRTRFPLINSAIAAGNLSGLMKNGGAEAAYAGSVQSFVNEYARVVSGGGTMTSDTARKEAMELLSTAQSPAMVHAAIKQLAQQETSALANAGKFTLETLAYQAKYPTLNKLSQKLGLPINDFAPAGSDTVESEGPQPIPGPHGEVVSDPLGIRK